MELSLQISITLAIVVIGLIFRGILQKVVAKPLSTVGEVRKRFVQRLLTISVWLVVILSLVILWGGSIENLWLSIAGVVGIIAIGFFAVWSVLSNIVVGAVLMLSKNFDIGDKIIVYPEKLRGKLVDITAFFVVLENKGKKVLIPNNQFIQKVVVNQSNKK